jgi:hypothetical protein
MNHPRSGSKLLIFELSCLAFGLFSLLQLTPPFHPARSTTVRDTVFLVNTMICAAGFYGIHKREPLAWTLGWLGLGLFFSEWIVFCMVSALKARVPDVRYIFLLLVVIGFRVATYWGYGWWCQKVYFTKSRG